MLDVGCWEGHFLPSLLANYSIVCALDNDTASLMDRVSGTWTILQTARDLCVAEGFEPRRLFLAKADGTELPFRAGSYRQGPLNLIGYDYRRDEGVIRKHFWIRQRNFLPNRVFAWLSPTILLAGKAKLRYRTSCS